MFYFEKDEIISTKAEQLYDAFEDLKDIRRMGKIDGTLGDVTLNKIKIDLYAPKEEEIKILPKKKDNGKQRKSPKNSHAGDGDMAEEGNNNDVEADDVLK